MIGQYLLNKNERNFFGTKEGRSWWSTTRASQPGSLYQCSTMPCPAVLHQLDWTGPDRTSPARRKNARTRFLFIIPRARNHAFSVCRSGEEVAEKHPQSPPTVTGRSVPPRSTYGPVRPRTVHSGVAPRPARVHTRQATLYLTWTFPARVLVPGKLFILQ